MNSFDSIHEKINQIYKSRGLNKILFVCLGNLCRSPMAEFLFKEKLKESGLENINISSSGFLNQKGARVPREVNELMNEVGINISEHRSSPLTPEIINESDLIVVMEKGQQKKLADRFPEDAFRIFLLSQFDKQNPEERDIPDPIGQLLSFYRKCFDDIKALVEGLAIHLPKTH